ncbi:MAG: class E sortase [Actinomycetota bacterium]|nr:class E sortase [Actinomycetota bacterium]
MRITNVVLNVMSLLLVGAGLALIATFFFPSVFLQPTASSDTAGAPQGQFDAPVLTEETEATTVIEDDPTADEMDSARPPKTVKQPEKSEEEKKEEAAIPVPDDKTLWVTVPGMNQIGGSPIPYTTGDDEEKLRNYAGIHLQGTGFPWEKEANVYIAGHRLGYPNTASFLAFWDLNRLENGDEIYVTDALGRSYTYRVFKEFVVNPSDIFVTQPLEGKNVITLQTCTLPDYSQRLIVQAEKVA